MVNMNIFNRLYFYFQVSLIWVLFLFFSSKLSLYYGELYPTFYWIVYYKIPEKWYAPFHGHMILNIILKLHSTTLQESINLDFHHKKKKQTKNEHFCSSVLFEVKCVMHTVLSCLLLRHFAPPSNRKII